MIILLCIFQIYCYTVNFVNVCMNASAHKTRYAISFWSWCYRWLWITWYGCGAPNLCPLEKQIVCWVIFPVPVCVCPIQEHFKGDSLKLSFLHMTYSSPYSYNTSSGSNPGHIMVVSAQCQKHALNIELGI